MRKITRIGIQPDMVPMNNVNDYEIGDRLFFEEGFKLDPEKGYGRNWIRTGQFIEGSDPERVIKNDERFHDIDFIKHHNFMLIKKKKISK